MRLLAGKPLLDLGVLIVMQMSRCSGSLAHWAPMYNPSPNLVYKGGMFCPWIPREMRSPVGGLFLVEVERV